MQGQITIQDAIDETALVAQVQSAARALGKSTAKMESDRERLYALLKQGDEIGVSRSELIRQSGISRKTLYRLVSVWEDR